MPKLSKGGGVVCGCRYSDKRPVPVLFFFTQIQFRLARGVFSGGARLSGLSPRHFRYAVASPLQGADRARFPVGLCVEAEGRRGELGTIPPTKLRPFDRLDAVFEVMPPLNPLHGEGDFRRPVPFYSLASAFQKAIAAVWLLAGARVNRAIP
jgi:hypothetical protein